MTTTSTPPEPTRERFVFIDALRGIACLAVLVHHLFFNTLVIEPLRQITPSFITWLAFCGTYGVQIFFVLSGFVIAHSLRETPLTGKSVGLFILRRQVRLDPPYWTMIAITLVMHLVAVVLMPQTVSPLPSLYELVLNLFYLQRIFGAEGIVMVAWTLCIEIQFYLVFILLLWVAALWSQRKPGSAAWKSTFLLFSTGAISLVLTHGGAFQAWFIHYWFYFVAGVLCYRTLRQEVRPGFLAAFLFLFAASTLAALWTGRGGEAQSFPFMLVGLVTSCAIYLVGSKGRLTTLWGGPLVQYFGRISYSLYLVHWVVVVTVFRLGSRVNSQSPVLALAYLLVAAVLSIAVAHVFFHVVEKPSMRFASRLKPQRTSEQESAPQATESGFAAETAQASSGAPL